MTELITIIDRIKDLKSIKTDTAVAEALGISQSAFAERKRKGSVPYEELVVFASREEISVDWLLTGEGPMRKAGHKSEKAMESAAEYNRPMFSIRKHDKPESNDDFVYVPRFSGEISAGGGLIPDNTIEMKIAFRREWIQRRGDPENMSLIRVSGDSMEPTLFSGDLVLVDHGRNYVDPQGGIYAISIDSSIMIKRIQFFPSPVKLKIISDNGRYESFESKPDGVKINGKVIWFGREIER